MSQENENPFARYIEGTLGVQYYGDDPEPEEEEPGNVPLDLPYDVDLRLEQIVVRETNKAMEPNMEASRIFPENGQIYQALDIIMWMFKNGQIQLNDPTAYEIAYRFMLAIVMSITAYNDELKRDEDDV